MIFCIVCDMRIADGIENDGVNVFVVRLLVVYVRPPCTVVPCECDGDLQTIRVS